MSVRQRAKAELKSRLRSTGLCLAVCGVLWGCAESSESPEVLVERGHLLEGRGEFQEAIDAYTKALASRPNDATIFYDRGVAFGRLSQWKEAADNYTRSIELDPSAARAFNNRAAAYAQQHQYELAIADFKSAIKLDPRSALTFRNRGLAYHDLNDLPKAIEDFTVAITMEPNAFDGPFERGNAYLDALEYKKAIADFDRAIELDATHAAAFVNRGTAYYRLGDTKRAQADIEKARHLDSSIPANVLAQSAPPPAVPTAVPSQDHVVPPDALARHEQALRVATDFLKAKGFQVESGSVPAPFDLTCAKGSRRLRVEVQAPAEEKSPLRFTRDQIEAAQHSDIPASLIVVEKLVHPAATGLPYSGGEVVDFCENWKQVQQKLVPVVFEYPRH
jgi:tetratricopeptide (TPR) repeat protein